MSEADRIAAKLIADYEAEARRRLGEASARSKVELVVADIRREIPGSTMTRVQANHFLGVLNGRDYRGADGLISPVYKAIERGLIRTDEVGGQLVVDMTTYIAWLRNYRQRSEGEESDD